MEAYVPKTLSNIIKLAKEISKISDKWYPQNEKSMSKCSPVRRLLKTTTSLQLFERTIYWGLLRKNNLKSFLLFLIKDLIIKITVIIAKVGGFRYYGFIFSKGLCNF